MADLKMVEFIVDKLASFTPAPVKASLRKEGHAEADVDAALSEAQRLRSQPSQPTQGPQQSQPSPPTQPKEE